MQTKIYLLNNAINGIGRGGCIQVQKMSAEYDYRTKNSASNLSSYRFPDFEPNFNSLVLRNGSTPTDLISHAPIPFYVLFVSEKLLKILLSFKLPPHKVYPAPIIHKSKNLVGYFAIQILDPDDYLNYIDFDKSKFYIEERISHAKIQHLKLKNRKDLDRIFAKEIGKKETKLRTDDLVMKDSFYNLVDLFFLSNIAFPVHCKVTEKLKFAIEKEECTGISFQSLSNNKQDIRDVLNIYDTIPTTYFPTFNNELVSKIGLDTTGVK